MSRSTASDALLAQLGEALLRDVGRRGADIAAAVRDRLPFYREGAAVSGADLEESCTANLRFVIEGIISGTPADPAPAAETGARRAAAEVPLAMIVDAYRIGFHAIWQQIVAEGQAQQLPTDTVLAATSYALGAHDVYVQAMSQAYNKALTFRILGQETERSALVEAVLTGSLTDRRTLWEAADLLRLPLIGPYVVVAAEPPSPGRLALPDIESALSAQGLASAWRLLPDLQVGIIAGPADGDWREVLERRTSRRVGISPEFDDLTGAGKAVDWARLAMVGNPAERGVSSFGEHPVGIAAVAAPEAMQHVAAGVLAGLDDLPAGDRDVLLDTLRCWVASDGSTAKTASTMFCHPNTIRHRLRRVEERTGRRLDRPADVAAICLALAVVAAGPSARDD